MSEPIRVEEALPPVTRRVSPPGGERGVDWQSVVERLRAEPNRWVLLPEFVEVDAVQSAYAIVKRKASPVLRSLPEGEDIEAIVRDSYPAPTETSKTRRRGNLFLRLTKED